MNKMQMVGFGLALPVGVLAQVRELRDSGYPNRAKALIMRTARRVSEPEVVEWTHVPDHYLRLHNDLRKQRIMRLA